MQQEKREFALIVAPLETLHADRQIKVNCIRI